MSLFKCRIWIVTIIIALLHGCASEPAPYLESRLGDAVNTARVQQTINLDASKNTDPVAGMDGRSAKTSIDTYYRSFAAPPPTFTIINVGGTVAK
jgi:PBP1b-binding outer membrane lipoprotein LpoB